LKTLRETPPWDWPRGTGKRLGDILRDRETDGGDRLIAAELAGDWSVDAAWPHVASLVAAEDVDKPLRLAAIDAVASIRPEDAEEVLGDLLDSPDEDIVEAVQEALAMAEGAPDDNGEDDEREL
jgi:hypothetical protein